MHKVAHICLFILHIYSYIVFCYNIFREVIHLGGKNSPASINRYMQKSYDRLNVLVPKGRREEIKAAAAAVGESMNQYIVTAINQRMEQDKQKEAGG